MEHKDFLGNELTIGDQVIYMERGYRELDIGTIVKLTKCKVMVQPRITTTGWQRSVLTQDKKNVVKIS